MFLFDFSFSGNFMNLACCSFPVVIQRKISFPFSSNLFNWNLSHNLTLVQRCNEYILLLPNIGSDFMRWHRNLNKSFKDIPNLCSRFFIHWSLICGVSVVWKMICTRRSQCCGWVSFFYVISMRPPGLSWLLFLFSQISRMWDSFHWLGVYSQNLYPVS